MSFIKIKNKNRIRTGGQKKDSEFILKYVEFDKYSEHSVSYK